MLLSKDLLTCVRHFSGDAAGLRSTISGEHRSRDREKSQERSDEMHLCFLLKWYCCWKELLGVRENVKCDVDEMVQEGRAAS